MKSFANAQSSSLTLGVMSEDTAESEFAEDCGMCSSARECSAGDEGFKSAT
jgi:hypothetical protein